MADNKAKDVDLNNPDFHDELEKAIEPNLKIEVKKDVKEPVDNKTDTEPVTVAEDWKKKYEDLKVTSDNTNVQYKASVEEGKRLAGELDKLKPYAPL